MSDLLEAVPNISEGRDPAVLEAVVAAAEAAGVEVLDASSDPDHHRSVVTFVGDPRAVEDAGVAVARVALERIDLRRHAGVHPRIGALDVLPFVPLLDTPMAVAVDTARRAADRIGELGVPAHLYAHASTPEGARLADLRRGGFEAYVDGFPEGRRPAVDAGRSAAHPTAGITCVGARPLLLAWNVEVAGLELSAARALAREIREATGGFRGLRALAFPLASRSALQISMNLEDVERNDPWSVFEAIEERVRAAGGDVVATEVIGMIPDPLVLAASARRLRLCGITPSRLLSRRIARHRLRFHDADAAAVASWVESADGVPEPILEAAARLRRSISPPSVPGDNA